MARTNESRRWQRSQTRLEAQIGRLDKERKTLLANADLIRDHNEKTRLWRLANQIEDRLKKLHGKLRRLKQHALDQQQPSLFD